MEGRTRGKKGMGEEEEVKRKMRKLEDEEEAKKKEKVERMEKKEKAKDEDVKEEELLEEKANKVREEDDDVEEEMGKEDVWIRPLSDKEEYFAIGHKLNYLKTHYVLHLTSSKPLHEDIFTSALTHLCRKVPVLRVCFEERRGQLWFKEMQRCVLDLKVLGNGVLKEEQDKLISHTFNTAQGPMFCVRVLSKGSGHHKGLDQCKGASYRYALLLGIHHSVADGFTNVRICHLLHTILDNLVAGRTVDDNAQLGQHVDGQMAEQLYQQEREKLMKDPELLKRRREQLLDATKTRPHLFDIFPLPEQDNARSLLAKMELDEKATQMFSISCKREGVTFHSGIIGLINGALVNLMEETGHGLDQYNFSCTHDLSMRRYYKGDTSQLLGAHLPLFSFRYPFVVSKDFLHSFWSTVKRFHKEFNSDLRDGAPLQSVALRLIQKPKTEIFKDTFHVCSDLPDYYYAISNMGDVTRDIPGLGDFVKVEDVDRFSSLRADSTIMCFYVLTYRGRLKVNLAYSSRFISTENAEKLLKLMKDLVSTLCDM